VLRYDDMRMSATPEDTLMEFLRSTYDVSADLAKWDRKNLD
jgi:hypothetical protein